MAPSRAERERHRQGQTVGLPRPVALEGVVTIVIAPLVGADVEV